MKKKILLIDDDLNILRLYGEVLEEEGYEVIRAATGNEALTALTTDKKISLTILDILLPDIDGLSILRKIKNDINPAMPVIMHTAYEYRDDFAVWAAENYIIKSSNSDELTKTVKALCPLS